MAASPLRRVPVLRCRMEDKHARLPWLPASRRRAHHAGARSASASTPGFARPPEEMGAARHGLGRTHRVCASRPRSSPAPHPPRWNSTRSSGTQSDTRYPCAGGMRPGSPHRSFLNTSFRQASKRIRCEADFCWMERWQVGDLPHRTAKHLSQGWGRSPTCLFGTTDQVSGESASARRSSANSSPALRG